MDPLHLWELVRRTNSQKLMLFLPLPSDTLCVHKKGVFFSLALLLFLIPLDIPRRKGPLDLPHSSDYIANIGLARFLAETQPLHHLLD